MSNTHIDRRCYNEVLTLYELENEIIDIYVEGITDKNILEWYLEKKKITNINIIEISDIDLPSDFLDLDYFESNNRDRVIALIMKLNTEECFRTYNGVVDKDILPYTRFIPTIPNLLFTDFSCIEMYYNNEYIINKILKIGYNKEVSNIENLLNDVSIHLQKIFAFRICEKKELLSLRKLDYKKFITVKDNKLGFNFDNYLIETLNSNGMRGKYDNINCEIVEILETLKDENILNTVHGHDFVEFLHILFLKLKFLKNTSNLENFEALLKCSLEIDFLDEFELFNSITNLNVAI